MSIWNFIDLVKKVYIISTGCSADTYQGDEHDDALYRSKNYSEPAFIRIIYTMVDIFDIELSIIIILYNHYMVILLIFCNIL